MKDGGRRGGSSPAWRELGRGAVAAAVVLAFGLVAAVQTQRVAEHERVDADRVAVATTAAGVATDLERGLAQVGDTAALVSIAAPAVSGPLPSAAVPGAQQMGYVANAAGVPDAGAVLSAAQRGDPTVASVLARTWDSGAPEPALGLTLDGTTTSLLVAPVYRMGSRPGPPLATTGRRVRLQGWVVAVIDLDRLGQLHQPPGVTVAVTAGPVPDGPGTPERFPAQRVAVREQPVTIVGGDPDDLGLTTRALAIAIAAVVAAAAVGVAVAGMTRRARRTEDELERTAAQVRLIGEVAPLVQQSLELAEVLPAVAVQLMDHFGLAGVGLSTGTGTVGRAELFRLGERADPPPKAVLRPPDHLAAGEAVTVALQRGGRTVAVLELVAGRALDATDLRTLQAITELVTAAVVNASLYASQQVAVRRLRDLDAMKTVFLGTASHELRTPATAISGFASLLTSGWDKLTEEQRQDFIARIAANARSLSAVVQDLLDFSLLDREAVPLALASVELDHVVKGVIDRLAPMFTDHVISYSATPSDPVLAELNGLERVVTNLLTNAVKFSPPASTVRVTVAPRDAGAEVVVCDEGPGVPVDERQRVFTRFFRGSGEVVVKTRGVGIGLSVVAELVERMQGRIVLDDAPGGGARFTVWLPRGTVSDEQEVRADATTG